MLKIAHVKKVLLYKLVIDCEDGVLKTTEALCDDKKVACEKIHCLFHTILLVNI